MTQIKAYTDLEQSKKLAEILPLESANMHYNNASIKGINYVDEHRAELMEYNRAIEVLSKYTINPLFEVIPCWSLTVLIDVLPRIDIEKETWSDDTYDYRVKVYIDDGYVGDWFDNPIDACYDMIITLNKDKLL